MREFVPVMTPCSPGLGGAGIDADSCALIDALGNPHVRAKIEEFVALCRPDRITVVTDSPEDIAYVRRRSLELGEEMALEMEGHTVHFDGMGDQARDKANTRVLTPPGMKLSRGINTIDREEGLAEVTDILDGIMEGKEAFIRFYTLGPQGSRFSLLALQITDSAYVSHSEDLLYRPGYEQFKALEGSDEFFTFVHSAGPLDHRHNSADLDKRRIYIDVTQGQVYTVNNQYAGNSLGLKKLALRLAIYKANHEDWLTEHMLIMGVHPKGKDRVTYFTGAYPSGCGKTSTSMLPGQTIVGDDIAYLRQDDEGNCRAVNIEAGCFGIIKDVNAKDDPIIHEVITSPREMIFSNVLVKDGKVYWQGMGTEPPTEGINFSGPWHEGKTDASGKPVALSHANARYTIRIDDLANVDPHAHDPEGVIIDGVLYGGRDSDTNVPVAEALTWAHGVYMGATIESETTATTLDAVGVRKPSPMAIMDFMVVPLGVYLTNHIDFGYSLKRTPRVFYTNYFLKKEGRFVTEKTDKLVWLMWAEGRVHGEFSAIHTPVGFLPRFEDLHMLFWRELGRNYSREEYTCQFSIRIPRYLAKIERMRAKYAEEEEMPLSFWDVMDAQEARLRALMKTTGSEVVPPEYFEGAGLVKGPRELKDGELC